MAAVNRLSSPAAFRSVFSTGRSYAQGAVAQTVAATTILLTAVTGLPVSTTHVLNSGVAGTMAANRSGIQWKTVGKILTAWVFTLPSCIVLAGSLFWIGRLISG